MLADFLIVLCPNLFSATRERAYRKEKERSVNNVDTENPLAHWLND